MIYRTQGEHANHYIIDVMVLAMVWHLFLAWIALKSHVSYNCHQSGLVSVINIDFSHFNLLLWNKIGSWMKGWLEWALDGILPILLVFFGFFHVNSAFKMVSKANDGSWLAKISKIFISKTTYGRMNCYNVGMLQKKCTWRWSCSHF